MRIVISITVRGVASVRLVGRWRTVVYGVEAVAIAIVVIVVDDLGLHVTR